VVIEDKLARWIVAGLDLYKNSPLLTESVFYDASQVGQPTGVGDGFLIDQEKLWLPNEYAGGFLRWGSATYPIIANTDNTLSLEGDPSGQPPPMINCYQILPSSVAGLTELLNTEKFTVSTAFAQIPTQMPCFTLRLEKDMQEDTYIGESLKTYTRNGTAFDITTTHVSGSYVISIWTQNRDATLWLYAWLMTYSLRSMKQFASWELYDVSLSGSDLDPALQYLAERTYTRHLLLSATRPVRAVTTREVETLTGLEWEICVNYQTFDLTVPAME
jgi:hypothetical protein